MEEISEVINEINYNAHGWLQCKFCKVVDQNRERSRVGHLCNICKKPGNGSRAYFDISIHLTIDLILEAFKTENEIHLPESQYEFSLNTHNISVLIFFCTLREILLNNLIKYLLNGLETPQKIQDRLLKDNKLHIQKQEKLFKSLTGAKWNLALSKLSKTSKYNYIQLNNKIIELVETRNSFVHQGSGFDIDREVAKNCIRNINPLIHLYVELHNTYVHPIYLNNL